MELVTAARMLSAIGHPMRLKTYRLLMQAGPVGLPAGQLAQTLNMAPSSLNFHLKEMISAELIHSHCEGRFVIYAATYPAMTELIQFLTDNCCGGNPCLPIALEPCAVEQQDAPSVKTTGVCSTKSSSRGAP
jgi:ArsR family transcriptional regulator, arsenate/arsenite/antimonite-responsive transcriptional repressor